MAKLVPSIEEIKNSKPYPEKGELALIESLYRNLDDSYEIYFQSYLNGLHPDIVILRDGYGVFIIEVKDWDLENYKYGQVDNNNRYGKMFLKKNNAKVKNPFDQVMAYKNSLYQLYLPELAIENIKSDKVYGIVKVGVYFHEATSEKIGSFFNKDKIKFISILGNDSNIIEVIKDALKNKSKLDKNIYDRLRILLTPIYHKANEGKNIKLNDKQLSLIESKPNLERKVKGIAGCGKTTTLAHKAVNVVRRKGARSRVLVLSYNITLKNYIRDKISAIRENFSWNNFNIIHFASFIMQAIAVENINIHVSEYNEKDFFKQLKVEDFKGKISEENKYDAILIDEGQDFQKEWFYILKEFLKDDGEFFIMADEKQNIYNNELDSNKNVVTNIKGAWNILNKSHRLYGRISYMSLGFQKEFFSGRYELDKDNNEKIDFDFENWVKSNKELSKKMRNMPLMVQRAITNPYIKQIIDSNFKNYEETDQQIIYKYNEKISYKEIFEELKEYADSEKIHFNDICLLSGEIKHIRELEYYIRKKYNINSEIMFETKEEFDAIHNKHFKNNNKNKEALNKSEKNELEKIRRMKKFGFNNNSGKLKLCTIHSFKGWEIDTLVIIIDKNDEKISDELIYTAITRCKKNLLIYNRGKEKYHKFFKNHANIMSGEPIKNKSGNTIYYSDYVDDGEIYCSEDGSYHDAEEAWMYDGSMF